MSKMVKHSPSIFGRYRWRELSLFFLPCCILLLEMTQLILSNLDPGSSLQFNNLPLGQGLTPILGLIAAFFVTHIVLNIFFGRADQFLLPLVGLLSGLGILMATRLGPDIVPHTPTQGTHQLTWVIVGLLVFLLTMFALRDINWLARYKYTAALFGVILFCTTLVQTFSVKNLDSPTHDQLKLGSFTFQPSELLKICIVIFFAAYMGENRDILAEGNLRLGPLRLPPLRQLGPIILMLGLSLVLFLVVRELGLAMLIYGIFLAMIYLSTSKLSYVIVSLLIFFVLGYIGYLLFSYVKARFLVVSIDMLNWTPRSDDIYLYHNGGQIVQGLIALSSGGVMGAGLGLGHPAGMGYVPVVQSDMVLTAFGEELGLAGLFAIFGIYLLIIYRGFRIAMQATDPFQQLLAAGLTSIFAIQTLIITAGNLKMIPLTGIPLPFLSYGGSSIIGNFIIVAILLRISHNNATQRKLFA